MNPPRSEGFVHMPEAEFEAILTRAAEGEADQKNVQWTFFPPNAKRALARQGNLIKFVRLGGQAPPAACPATLSL